MGFEVLDARGNVKIAGGGGRGAQGAAGANGANGILGKMGPRGFRGHDAWQRRPSGILTPVRLNQDVTGNLGVSHFNSGTDADETTVWRGDGVWAPYGQLPTGDDTGSPEVFFAGDNNVGGGTGNRDISNTQTRFSGSSASPNVDADGCWMRFGSTATGTVSILGFTNEMCVAEGDCWFATKFRTVNPSAAAGFCRIWLGFTDADFTAVDTHAGNCVAIRYSQNAGDAGFLGVTRSAATGNQSVTSVLANIADNTVYKIRMGLTGGGTTAVFVVNGVSATLTSNIPTGVLFFAMLSINRIGATAGARNLDVLYEKVWR